MSKKNIAIVEVKENRLAEAEILHNQVLAKGQAVAHALAEFCAELKKMRDSKLYAELGFETFDEYVDKKVGIKSRQAYNYIRVYEQLPPEMLDMDYGIKKLELLTSVPSLDRKGFLNEHDIKKMTTAELFNVIQDIYGKNEQLTLELAATKENQSADESVEELKNSLLQSANENEDLKRQIEELEQAEPPQSTETVDVDMLKKEWQTAFEITKQKEIFEAKKEAAKKAEQDAEKKIEKAKQEGEKIGEEKAQKSLNEDMARIKAEKEQAAARAEDLQKKLKLASSTDTTAFTLLFDQFTNAYENMIARIDNMLKAGNKEDADKLINALSRGLDELKKQTDKKKESINKK